MDGIELGQGTSSRISNVEIGRTSISQDDGTDSQDLGTAQGIQIETSPRRTWSGKVVKYRVD
jgi:hypothetical protein